MQRDNDLNMEQEVDDFKYILEIVIFLLFWKNIWLLVEIFCTQSIGIIDIYFTGVVMLVKQLLSSWFL